MNDTFPNPDPIDKTVPARSVPHVSSGTYGQGDQLLQSGMMLPPQAPGSLGTIGKYQVIKILGEGAMGQVVLAREPITDSMVAIKLIKPEFLNKSWAVHRFLTEARHMFRMSHGSIIRVLDVSDRPEGPYFVMPYMTGGSLADKIKPGEPLQPETILPVARAVAEALHHAHTRGITHRDLKPSNILLDAEGKAFLADFGLLRTFFNDSIVDASQPQLEGTVPYMSPAVAAGKAEDTRCDIYAFGCLLYEMLTGQPPYQGPTVDAVLKQIQDGPPPPIRQLNPHAPAALTAIADHAMARELRDRYASMADVVAELERVAQGKAPIGTHGREKRSYAGRKVLATTFFIGIIGLAALEISKIHGMKQNIISQETSAIIPAGAVHSAKNLLHADAHEGLLHGLVLHFGFDDIQGDKVIDESNNGNDGILKEAMVTPGKVGNSLGFHNNRSIVSVPHSTSINLDKQLTLSSWIRGGLNQPSKYPRVIDKLIYTQETGFVLGFVLDGARGRFSVCPDLDSRETETSYWAESYDETLDNQWHHLAGTFDGLQLRYYVDGTMRSSTPFVGRIALSGKKLTIGNGFDGNHWFPFSGSIDEVSIFNRALPDDEVKRLYELGVQGQSIVRARVPIDVATKAIEAAAAITTGQSDKPLITPLVPPPNSR